MSANSSQTKSKPLESQICFVYYAMLVKTQANLCDAAAEVTNKMPGKVGLINMVKADL